MKLLNKMFTLFIAAISCNALNLRNFDATGSGSKGAPKIATYSTSDETATIQGAGYFNSLSTLLVTGDLIYVYSSGVATATAPAKIYQVTVSGTTVTLSTSVALS